MIKVALLECKSGAIAAKTGFLLLLFFCTLSSQTFQLSVYKPFILARSKLENFAPKILLCAERGVLSVRNANIVTEHISYCQEAHIKRTFNELMTNFQ